MIKTRKDAGIPIQIPTFSPVLFTDQRRTSVDVTAESDMRNTEGQNIQKMYQVEKTCSHSFSDLSQDMTLKSIGSFVDSLKKHCKWQK